MGDSARCLELLSRVSDDSSSCWQIEKNSVEKSVIPYWHKRSHLSIGNDILLHGSQIVVPHSLRKETLEKIHHGHQGIVRCRLRMKNSVWWPGASTEIAQRVDNCTKCAKVATPRKEPLISSPTPDYPWQVVGSDLFELNGTSYLLVVDYLSRFPEVVKLTRNTTSSAIISLLKSIFSRHGIPKVLRSDNGPQYASEEIQEFAKQYGFKLVTSSPRYPQSNGFIERMVKTVKQLFSQSDDQDLALLTYRSTPLPWCGYSPAELSMGRNVRTPLPQTKDHLVPILGSTYPTLVNTKKSSRGSRNMLTIAATESRNYQCYLKIPQFG